MSDLSIYSKDAVDLATQQLKDAISTFFAPLEERKQELKEASAGIKLMSEGSWKDGAAKIKLGHLGRYRLQIKAPAGLGKTTEVCQHIAKLNDMVVWFAVPNDKLALEVVEDLKQYQNITVQHVEGRKGHNCSRYDVVNKFQSLNSISNLFCKSGDNNQCSEYLGCPYYEQFQESESTGTTVYVIAHNYLVINSLLPKPDLIVIDEKHWQVFAEKKELKIEHLCKYQSQAHKNSDIYKRFIEILQKCTESSRTDALEILNSFGHENIDKARNFLLSIRNKKLSGLSPRSPDIKFKQALRHGDLAHLNSIIDIFEIIKKACKEKNTVALAWQKNNGIIEASKFIPMTVHHNAACLILDASADIKINRVIWGERLQEVVINAPRNAKFVQVKKSFSKYSMGIGETDPSTEQLIFRQNTIDYINWVASKHKGKILLVAPKGMLEEISDDFAQNIMTANYGNLRGLNQFKDFEIAIILGREQPPPNEIEASSRSFLTVSNHDQGWLINQYIKSTPEYMMLNGKIVTGTKQALRIHPNDFTNRFLLQTREEEMLQAIDRLRLVHSKEEKLVIILSDIPLGLPLYKLWKWDEAQLGGSKLERAFQIMTGKGKAFPLSGTECVKLCPELWSTLSAFNGYLNRNGGIKCLENQIISLMENETLIKATYRRHGQRGKSTYAIIADDENNPRKTLENVIGEPIKSFEIIEYINTKE